MSTFEHIIVEGKGAVGVITLNRPRCSMPLSFGVFGEIAGRHRLISKPTTESDASC